MPNIKHAEKSKWFLLVLLVLVIVLSACGGNAVLPEEAQPDDEITVPAEPPEQELVVEAEETDEPYELPPGTLFVRPEPVDHPLADELLALVSEFSGVFLFPEFEDVQSIDFYSPEVSFNLNDVIFLRNIDLLAADRGVPREELELSEAELLELSITRYDDMIAVGRQFFGDDFYFAKGEVGRLIVPMSDDPSLYVSIAEWGAPPFTRYLLVDLTEYEEVVAATFLPHWPLISWIDQTITDVAFLNPNPVPDRHHTFWPQTFWPHLGVIGPAILEFPDEETRMGTVFGGDVDFWDYLYLLVPQEELGTITVTFQRADDGRMIAISSRYNRHLT